MTSFERNGHVAYKYQRRVPSDVASALRRKTWDLSLGSDLTKATARCAQTTAEHDELIALFRDPNALENARAPAFAETTAIHIRESAQLDPETFAATWRDTEVYLDGARGLTPERELETLAIFARQAFGDPSHLENLENPTAMAGIDWPVAKPPDDNVELRLYGAMKTILDERIADLLGESPQNEPYRLSALLERYLDLSNPSSQTKRNYISKVNRLTDHIGDLPLNQYTPEKLRLHRDYLLTEGLSPNSVAQYFAPTKAVMRWAISEDLVPGFDAIPTDKVSMPRGGKTIEERRWQRFDDEEIKKVWVLLQESWGKGSKLSPARRAAFLMVFRVLLYTALRPVEVFRLMPEDVTPDIIRIRKTKTRIARNLPLSKHISEFYEFMQADGLACCGKPHTAAQKMSDMFTKAIREGGFSNDRHVLYSAKDTLVDRLQRAQRSEDVIRGVTGHVSGQGHLRSCPSSEFLGQLAA
ncbi:phage integrase SAM-like domain-containing protein [Phaeobacter gallaeciensis]|uniref:DUF6538 domain-containing protein n=1 Tax=Phaeobacter gallaeciensis TaxID=60890 RepID=UPI0023807A1F|nr:DUF6538 domain-containing protein [Phaeobacter gallaeciensis]MDE4276290.1 phage integrase SAM-like domain-containing protein [Phaeobacter gallaeciensis]MDE4301519.1 phage integrase SAM-like domain-containing protein [Phaeobacter gallaeciensis]MDE5186674.1 phage integrase SAM-like domain-containing protein [Phaeobacter gallaeciensis]